METLFTQAVRKSVADVVSQIESDRRNDQSFGRVTIKTVYDGKMFEAITTAKVTLTKYYVAKGEAE